MEPLGLLQRLTEFKLKGNLDIGESDFIRFVIKMEKLRRLSISLDEEFKVEQENYQKMLDVVHARRQSLILHFGYWESRAPQYEILYIEKDVLPMDNQQ